MRLARTIQRGVTLSHTETVLTRLSPEYCRLVAYKQAYKGGGGRVTGTPGPPWLYP